MVAGRPRTLRTEHVILVVGELVVVHEERFQLAQEMLAHVLHCLDRLEAVAVRLDGYQAIVPLGLTVLDRFALDHADQPAVEHAARERWLIHQHQYIDRIAVAGDRRRHESEVVRKAHAGG